MNDQAQQHSYHSVTFGELTPINRVLFRFEVHVSLIACIRINGNNATVIDVCESE